MNDVVIVGGGLVGLSSAWRAAQAGMQVAVVDPAPGSGASGVAAGMLAPVTEVHYGEEALLRLNIAGARRWPGFAAELESASGSMVGYQQDGTLLVGFDADDHRVLDDLHRFQQELGLDVERLRSRACRAQEPMLSPRVRGGLLAREDHQVDPRRVTAALVSACRGAGVRLVADEVVAVEKDDDRVGGVRLRDGGHLPARQVVLAAGAASSRVPGLGAELRPPVRPVKGQILRLRSRDGAQHLSMAVRGVVQGRSIYLVPRRDGEVVVGATQEELGDDVAVTAGGVRELLDSAAAIVPGIDEFLLVETAAGSRPGTPDNRPLVGPSTLPGLLIATGHHRNGVLLTPITSEAVVAFLLHRPPPDEMAVADPLRPGIRGTSGRREVN